MGTKETITTNEMRKENNTSSLIITAQDLRGKKSTDYKFLSTDFYSGRSFLQRGPNACNQQDLKTDWDDLMHGSRPESDLTRLGMQQNFG